MKKGLRFICTCLCLGSMLLGTCHLSLPVFASEAAEGSEASQVLEVKTNLDNGRFYVEIPVEEGDMGWLAEDTGKEAPFVKLREQSTENGVFTARYDPVVDGMVTVAVKHYYHASACDHAITFDLKVRDGAVQEVVGGSEAKNSPDEELDPYLCGQWVEEETQFTDLTITKNEQEGWDLVLVSPMSHGAYVFKTTVYQDCEKGLVYDKGKYWDLPEDGNIEAELGEARAFGTSGSFALSEDEGGIKLSWEDSERPEEILVYGKVEE